MNILLHPVAPPRRFRGPAAAALLLAALAPAAPQAAGCGPDHPDRVALRSGCVTVPEAAAGPARDGLAPGESDIVVLKLREPLTPAARRHAEAHGVRLEAFLGGGAYLARVPADPAARRSALPGAARIAAYPPALRIAPEITELTADDPRAAIPVTLHLAADADVAARAAELRSLGVRVAGTRAGAEASTGRAGRPGRIVALPTPAQLPDLRARVAGWSETLWLGRRPAYRLLNDSNAWIMQSGLDGGQSTPLYDHGLFGRDQVIAVLDTGLDADMCYFRDDDRGPPPINVGLGVGVPDPLQRKVLIVNFLATGDDPADPTDWDDQDHGTHVAGSALGDMALTPGRRDPGDGMAPEARLIVQDGGFRIDDCADLPAIGCPAADLYPFFEQARLQGARIHSNSYGDRENFTPSDIYSEGSQAADAFMWDHPDFLLVFAAGNGGPGDSTIGSPATAKNVLAVGAAAPGLGAGGLASFSSRGPTADGRIKPDVIAPGQGIVSADGDGDNGTNQCAVRSLSGTSMACPTAAGIAALARQYYTEGFYPGGKPRAADAFVPSAALLKATLIASARAMEGVPARPPSNAQGWGRVLLDDALYLAGDFRRARVFDVPQAFASATDPEQTHGFEVLAGSEPLSVALVWTDYPSNPAATINLVNDLNLELVSPSGTLYRGNVFIDGESQGDSGSADDRNNVEVVRIAEPEPGAWTARVRPHVIPLGPQGYALVIGGRLRAAGVALERTVFAADDTAGGNADGVLDPGEWIDLHVTLLNSGDAPAVNVALEVESDTPGVAVTRAAATLPDLAPNDQAAATTAPLQIRIDPGFPCAESFVLRLSYLANGFEFTETLTLRAGAERLLFVDDFETPSGWQHVAAESTATGGAWVVGDPDGTQFQPEHDATPDPGVNCLFTATNFGGLGEGDVDNGVVVARSGSYDLSGHPDARLRVTRWFGNRDLGEDAGDAFRLAIRQDAGSADVVLEELGTDVNAALWTTVDFRVADHVPVGPAVELRVSAADPAPVANIIEAAIDDVIFWEPACEVFVPPPSPPNPVDDLRLSRSGDDVVLNWSRPVLAPDHAAATRYGVYDSATPDAGFSLIESVADTGSLVQFVHAGALPGAPVAFYLVIAGNAAGDAEALP